MTTVHQRRWSSLAGWRARKDGDKNKKEEDEDVDSQSKGDRPQQGTGTGSWSKRGMPSVSFFVFRVLLSLIWLWSSWHGAFFYYYEWDNYQLALHPPEPVGSAFADLPPVPTAFGCEQCHVMPMNASLFNCVGCREPPPPSAKHWEQTMNLRAIQRDAIDHYYREHTILLRDNICELSDGLNCPSGPLDWMLAVSILNRKPVTLHFGFLCNIGSFLFTLVLLVRRVIRFVQQIRKVHRAEAKQRKLEQDEREREDRNAALTSATTLFMAPSPLALGGGGSE